MSKLDPKAQILLAVAILFIVLAVVVTVLSDKDWAKVVAVVSGILSIIFGTAAVWRAQFTSPRQGTIQV